MLLLLCYVHVLSEYLLWNSVKVKKFARTISEIIEILLECLFHGYSE